MFRSVTSTVSCSLHFTQQLIEQLAYPKIQEKLARLLLEKAEKEVATKEAAAKSAEAKASATKSPKAKAEAERAAGKKDEVALAAEAREKALQKAEVVVSRAEKKNISSNVYKNIFNNSFLIYPCLLLG